jgi:hypothetical protein
LSYQQDLTAYPIAVIVLRSRSNRLADLKNLIPDVLAQIGLAKPGAVTVIG